MGDEGFIYYIAGGGILKYSYLVLYGYENDEGVDDANYIWCKNEEDVKNEIEFLEKCYEDFWINEILWITDVYRKKNYQKHNESELILKVAEIQYKKD